MVIAASAIAEGLIPSKSSKSIHKKLDGLVRKLQQRDDLQLAFERSTYEQGRVTPWFRPNFFTASDVASQFLPKHHACHCF